jgi:hypothetical protein
MFTNTGINRDDRSILGINKDHKTGEEHAV